MSAGNPRGPVVLAGRPSDPAGVACDVAHLVANGATVAAVCDPAGALADALDALGVASETIPSVDDADSVPPGVVAVVPPGGDGGGATTAAELAAALGATLVALDEGCVAGCETDVTPVVAGGAPNNPVLSVLPTTTPDGGVEVAP